MKGFDERGMFFYTKQLSKDSQPLRNNDDISLRFNWFGMISKQATVQGKMEKVRVEEIQKYFNSRDKDDIKKTWWSANPKPTSFQ